MGDIDHEAAPAGAAEGPATASRRARATTVMMPALPGSAYLYQGEELGLLEVADLPADRLQDPVYERTGHRLKGRDGCRVPLPWTSEGPSFGFGHGDSWLPQPGWFADFSVAAEDGQDRSSLELYRQALKLRRSLGGGDAFRWIDAHDPHVLRFARPDGWECIVNFSTRTIAPPPNATILLSSNPASDSLTPETAIWIKRLSE